MPSVKLKENEPFDVALRRFKRSCEKQAFCLKYVVANSLKNQQLSVSVRKLLLLSVTKRK